MTTYSLQGDPKIYLTSNGATLKFEGGQPIMDGGLENYVFISLFTRLGWCGNTLARQESEKIGSLFEAEANKPITRTSLNNIRQAAVSALVGPLFGEVNVQVTNPISTQLKVVIALKPPTGDLITLTLMKNGLNWIMQSTNPAYRRI